MRSSNSVETGTPSVFTMPTIPLMVGLGACCLGETRIAKKEGTTIEDFLIERQRKQHED